MTELDISIRQRTQVIRFNRPDKKNALKSDMYQAMTDALIKGDASPDVTSHLFIGNGGVFTAGNDIAEFLERSKGGAALATPVVSFIMQLPQVEKPMIAAVDGLAVGIGTTLLFHCDLVYATTGYEPSVASFANVSLSSDSVFRDGSSLQMATVAGTTGSGLTAGLTVAIA